MTKDVQTSLDTLFGTPEDLQNTFEELKKECAEPTEPISNYNTKQVIEDDEVSTKNAKELVHDKTISKIEKKVAEKAEELISDTNSDRALPDELSKEDGVPITNVTEGIHVADGTDNTELISSHNSDNALPDELSVCDDVPISITNSEQMHDNELKEYEPISTHNSSKFVDN